MDQDQSPNPRLTYLFRQLALNKATPSQKEELMALMADSAHEQQVNELIGEAWENFDFGETVFTAEKSDDMLHLILNSPGFETEEKPQTRLVKLPILYWLSIAASLILLLSGAAYLFVNRKANPESVIAKTENDIIPGGGKSMLTLGNGRKILLDEAPVGLLIDQGSMKVSKLADGSLAYSSNEVDLEAKTPEFNTISTPKGGRYKVILPDGSKVWLNASSSLRYPTRFTGNQRQVELIGEAYLEVKSVYASHQGGKQKTTFKVVTGNQIVEVLGTHFNITNYDDEKTIKTTLLEGKIRVTGLQKGNRMLLNPGQQSSLSQTGDFRLLRNADIEGAVAWKDNNFRFNGSDIQSIMKQLSRWYNVDVHYEGTIPDGHLTGFISQNVPISRVLKMLEQTSDLKFRIEGRMVIVMGTKESNK